MYVLSFERGIIWGKLSTVIMPNTHYQPELSLNSPSGQQSDPLRLDMPDAEVVYQAQFLEEVEASSLFDSLLRQTPWRQESITLYGKTHAVPRLSHWVADESGDYSYSNITMAANPWTPELEELKTRVECLSGNSFNSVLLNYYRDGQDSNGWHSDDEPELGRSPVIASLSLGAVRDFRMRHKIKRELPPTTIALEHGSLLVMKGETQHYWQHTIPKRANVGARINLTFRTIY